MSKVYIEVKDGMVKNLYFGDNVEVVVCDYNILDGCYTEDEIREEEEAIEEIESAVKNGAVKHVWQGGYGMTLLERITDDLHEKCMEIFAQYQKKMDIKDGAEPWELSHDYDKAELQLAKMIEKILLWQKKMDNLNKED